MFPTFMLGPPATVEGEFYDFVLDNPGFETGDLTGWTVTSAQSPTIRDNRFQPEGNYCIVGHIGANNGLQTIKQVLGIEAAHEALVDGGTLNLRVRWWLGTYYQGVISDRVRVRVIWRDSGMVQIGTDATPYQQASTVVSGAIRWDEITSDFNIPPLTRFFDFLVDFDRNVGDNNDGAVDDFRLSLFAD